MKTQGRAQFAQLPHPRLDPASQAHGSVPSPSWPSVGADGKRSRNRGRDTTPIQRREQGKVRPRRRQPMETNAIQTPVGEKGDTRDRQRLFSFSRRRRSDIDSPSTSGNHSRRRLPPSAPHVGEIPQKAIRWWGGRFEILLLFYLPSDN